jgi:Winged helix-turn helix
MVKCTKREVRELRTALRWRLPALQRQRIQMVLLRESGMTQPAIGEAMGVSLSTVNRAHMAYDRGGLEALRPKPCGGRKRASDKKDSTPRHGCCDAEFRSGLGPVWVLCHE